MTQNQPLVKLEGVRKTFHAAHGEVNAVNGIDLTINAGEIVAFLGPNGAGKTTTIDMILGLTHPSSGKVSVLGRPAREAVSAGKVSAVMQTGGLLRDLTVQETLAAIASLHNAPTRIDEVVEKTQLGALLGRKVSKCSGGEQQRLKFALSLLSDPDLLILDEPTAGMDVNARREFWATMQADAESGRTILFATHYLEEAENFAQRTVLINAGQIIADGTTAHIRAIASGREVSATCAPHEVEHAVAAITALDPANTVSVNGTRITVSTKNSDKLARLLLNELDAQDLEISAPSLESAFVNLTASAAHGGSSGGSSGGVRGEARDGELRDGLRGEGQQR